MGSHRHRSGGGRHSGPPTVGRLRRIPAADNPSPPSSPAVPSVDRRSSGELPARKATGSRGPATASRGPATGARQPATGSRGPATGSRRAPGRSSVSWLPIALVIWTASFLAVPAAVLAHQAMTSDQSPVVEAGLPQGDRVRNADRAARASTTPADPPPSSGSPAADGISSPDPADGTTAAPGVDEVASTIEVLDPSPAEVSSPIVPSDAESSAAASTATGGSPGAMGAVVLTGSLGTGSPSIAPSDAAVSTTQESGEEPLVEELSPGGPVPGSTPTPDR